MNESDFRNQAAERGYGTVRNKDYAPNMSGQLHGHDFSVLLLVTEGELTLAFEDRSETFAVGDSCEVPAGCRHDERTGSTGAAAILATTETAADHT